MLWLKISLSRCPVCCNPLVLLTELRQTEYHVERLALYTKFDWNEVCAVTMAPTVHLD